jgi:chromosome segregation ATPase
MAPIKWDAYRSLNITTRDSGGTTCVGNTRYGKRCRWDIPDKKFSQICAMLDEFETKAPANAISSLERLAHLSLCEGYHQHKAAEKMEEWELAIQEATQFYESGKRLKEKNRELKEKLKEERSEKEELERELEAEISRRNQEVKSIGSMSMEVSSLRPKLKQAETEAEDSNGVAQRMSESYTGCEAEKEEANQMIHSFRLELKKLKASEKRLVNQVSELTLQLKTKFDAKNSTLLSELVRIESERDSALSQKDKVKSQLGIAAEKIKRIKFSLQEAESARDTLSREKQRLNAQLSIEHQNLEAISDAKAQLEEKYTQEVGTLNAQLSSERHNAAELRQCLQTATENLSSTQTQLRTVKEDFSNSKDELEKLQVEFAKVQDDSEERLKLSMHQAASLARMDELVQEMAYAKLHPFRTFFVNLFDVTVGWVKSVFACFGRSRTRKAFDRVTMEENMSSP